MTSERVFDQWTMEHGTVVLPYHIITYCAHHPNMIGFLLNGKLAWNPKFWSSVSDHEKNVPSNP